MILSRTLAKRRIAAGDMPSFAQAWWPVLADTSAISILLALVLGPVFVPIIGGDEQLNATGIAILAGAYVLFQAIVIVSSLWATKSRWAEEPPER